MCTDVTGPSATLDGNDVTQAFLAALDAQRSADDYTQEPAAALTCQTPATSGPATPAREQLVEAVVCPPELEDAGTALDGTAMLQLVASWEAATQSTDMCASPGESRSVLARTDRGDVIRMNQGWCGLEFYGWEAGEAAYQLNLEIAALTGS